MAVIEERINAKGEVSYRTKVRIKGYPVQSATFKRKTDAKKWASTTEAAIHEGRHFVKAQSKSQTFGDMIDRYLKEIMPLKPKSLKTQTQQLCYWKDKLGHTPLCGVSSSHINAIKNELSKGHTLRGVRSRATVNRYLAALSHVYTIAVKEWEWVHDNPTLRVSRLKESRGRTRYLSKAEINRLLSSCLKNQNKHLYPIVVLAISIGARKTEILTLQGQDIDFDRGVILLKETKNGDQRSLPLEGHAYDVLVKLYENQKLSSEYVFTSYKDKSKPMVDIKKGWARVLDEAQIKDFRFHDLRHTAASYLAMDGASSTDIAEILGHKTLQMVRRYSHLSETHTKKVVASMNQKIFGEDNHINIGTE
jgi:integrase